MYWSEKKPFLKVSTKFRESFLSVLFEGGAFEVVQLDGNLLLLLRNLTTLIVLMNFYLTLTLLMSLNGTFLIRIQSIFMLKKFLEKLTQTESEKIFFEIKFFRHFLFVWISGDPEFCVSIY